MRYYLLILLHPFPLLRQFQDRLNIDFLTREDNVGSDEDIFQLTNAQSLASLKQMHGNRAVIIRSDSRRTEQADALATYQPNLTLTIRFADCQNFIVYDPVKNIVALIHAGWRGLASGIIPSTFNLLQYEWAIDPKDIFVAAGPSLCMQCAEFTEPKTEAPELASYSEGRHIDLRKVADDQLFSLGIQAEKFERLPDCTCCSPATYWTYRGGDREEVKKGRINCLAVAMRAKNQESRFRNQE